MKDRKSLIRLLLTLSSIFILIAIGFTGYNYYEAIHAQKTADEAEKILEAEIEDMTPVFFEYSADTSSADVPAEVPEMSVMEINGEEYIGVLEVPSLNMKLPILSDCDKRRLKISPCRYYGSYYEDNLVLSGHNYKGGRHFSPLRNVALGADVYFTTADGAIIHYVVSGTEELKPTDVDRMLADTGWDLTLYTCTNSGGARHTVRCIRK